MVLISLLPRIRLKSKKSAGSDPGVDIEPTIGSTGSSPAEYLPLSSEMPFMGIAPDLMVS
jgi:hypothetical protein